MKKIFSAVAVATTLAVSGCATIVNSGTQPVTVNSTPDGATVKIVNKAGDTVFEGTTPATAELQRGSGFFSSESYTVTVSNATASEDVTMTGTFNNWTIGNIIFGGLIGLAVDASTGAMWMFEPDTVNVNLGTSAEMSIKNISELSEAERKTMRKL
ncbi:MAG: hypothetical protein AAGF20_02600 [Pseudomonadota bacterium]